MIHSILYIELKVHRLEYVSDYLFVDMYKHAHTHACTHTHVHAPPPHTSTHARTHILYTYKNSISANRATPNNKVRFAVRSKLRVLQHMVCKEDALMMKQDGRLTSWCFHRDFLCVTVNSVIPTCNNRHNSACETWLFMIPDIIIKYPYCSSQHCERKIVFSYTIVAGT